MLVESLNKILAALEEITDTGGKIFKTVDVWQGKVEELLKKQQNLPSAHVVMSGCGFVKPQVIGGTVAPADVVWAVVLMSKNLRSKSDGAVESLALIEAVAAKFTQLNTGYGFILPDNARLIAVENGVAAYGMYLGQEFNP